ncbi:MAG: hypothetical protein M1826_003827 [Phylliscum demangeonii]|nr:MAG: hypothetical protein M1826_003827 [Phylliscum demangeonii]
MHFLSSVISLTALLALVSQGSAALAALLKPDMGKLAEHAVHTLTETNFKKNNGFSHYFIDSNQVPVLKAFRAVTSDAVRFDFQCFSAQNCKSFPARTLTITAPQPEDFNGGPITKVKARQILICPAFFAAMNDQRKLPSTVLETRVYCENKASKKLVGFEVGGYSMMHAITELDTFSLAAGFAKEHEDADFVVPAFDFHGAIDWRGETSAANARELKTSTAKGRPHNFRNAESLVASAMEMFAMESCEIDNINL